MSFNECSMQGASLGLQVFIVTREISRSAQWGCNVTCLILGDIECCKSFSIHSAVNMIRLEIYYQALVISIYV